MPANPFYVMAFTYRQQPAIEHLIAQDLQAWDAVCLWLSDGDSSNGRTADSDSVSPGSNPGSPAIFLIYFNGLQVVRF